MFIRSENLFLRPAWPEDGRLLSRLDVPARHDPLRNGESGGLVITMPGARGVRLIGTAGFAAVRRKWQPRLWLAPAWRYLGLHDEAEDSLAQLIGQLPPPGGIAPSETDLPVAA